MSESYYKSGLYNFERAQLEALAAKWHWRIVDPPTLTGFSSAPHKFLFVAIDGQRTRFFDACEKLNENEVLTTYIKKFDLNEYTKELNTKPSAYIICRTQKMTKNVRKMLKEYEMMPLPSDKIESALLKKIKSESRGHRDAAA